MIDLFGIRSRQEVLIHMRKIHELEDVIQMQKGIIEFQGQKIENLKNEVTWFGNDIDFIYFNP